jgi:hypothetical protein
MMERVNSTMIYDKNFYKCHNVFPAQQFLKMDKKRLPVHSSYYGRGLAALAL